MRTLMNRGGYTQLGDSGMFFLCFIIIISGIVFGVYLFYQNQSSNALVEAHILTEKISRVFIASESFNQELLREDFDIFAAAQLDRLQIDNEDHYVWIEIIKGGNLLRTIAIGNRDFSVLCGLAGEELPECFRTKVVKNDYVIRILSGVRERRNK